MAEISEFTLKTIGLDGVHFVKAIQQYLRLSFLQKVNELLSREVLVKALHRFNKKCKKIIMPR